MKTDKEKLAIGYFGEQAISANLERIGWEVATPILGGNIDIIISRYFCINCRKKATLWKKETSNEEYKLESKDKRHQAVINKCNNCQKETVIKQVRFIQVKASSGINKGKKGIDFSFHPKLRYHVDPRTFYVWMAIFQSGNESLENCKFYTYIFHTSEVNKFDNINLDSYQKTDNQQTHLYIDKKTGIVTNSPEKYKCFYEEFLNSYDKFDQEFDIDFGK